MGQWDPLPGGPQDHGSLHTGTFAWESTSILWSQFQGMPHCLSLNLWLSQVFVFRDYLPHIVGNEATSRYLRRYPGYDANIDASVTNVFATAAYRFAHLAIQPNLARLDGNYRENAQFPSVSLFTSFFTPWRIVFEGGLHWPKCNWSVGPSETITATFIWPLQVALTLWCVVSSHVPLNWTLRITWWWTLWETSCLSLCSTWLWIWALSTCRGGVTTACLVHLSQPFQLDLCCCISFPIVFKCLFSCDLFSSRLQCLAEVLWPVSAAESGWTRTGPE